MDFTLYKDPFYIASFCVLPWWVIQPRCRRSASRQATLTTGSSSESNLKSLTRNDPHTTLNGSVPIPNQLDPSREERKEVGHKPIRYISPPMGVHQHCVK